VWVTGAPGDSVRIGEGERTPARLVGAGAHEARVEYDGRVLTFTHAPVPGGRWLGLDGGSWRLLDHDPVASRATAGGAGGESLTAPMPGTVTVVKAAVGEAVTAGQSLLVVEAMKMEHPITAPHDGTVTALEVTVGDTVAMDQTLATVTAVTAGAPGGER
ncbi:acetyl-CoA carboxylase biotin carboxyl carrier protein subunit, partial [Streptomyces sedi]